MDVKNKTYLTFVIQDFEDKPQELSEKIGIDPTVAYQKGDLKSFGKGAISVSRSVWQLKSQMGESSEVDDLAEDLLAILEPRREQIIAATGALEVWFSFAIYFTDTPPAIQLSPDLTRRIAALGAGVDFDVYVLGD